VGVSINSFATTMKQEIKEQFPQWTKEQGNYNTVLTNDIDSLLGCAIEKYVKGYEINHFYDFNTLYMADRSNKTKTVSVDLAVNGGMSWDNHVVMIGESDYVNPNTANLNAIYNINKSNYTQKYCMSTAIMMWSFYNLPLPETKEGKMLLLCIDSGFKGHYNKSFNKVHTEYLKLLGFEELIDLLNNTNYNDYVQLQKKYKLHSNIELNNEGYLQTNLPLSELEGVFNLPLELPKQQFSLKKQFTSWRGDISNVKSKSQVKPQIVSFALTGKNYCNFTYKENENGTNK